MENSAQMSGFHGECAAGSGGTDRHDPRRLSRRKPPPGHGKSPDRYDRDQLLACAAGELFGAGNARLPLPPLLLIDRISHINNRGGLFDQGEIVGELDITPDLWFFAAHFPGDPVMPGCFALDALWQLLGFYLAWSGCPGRGRALGVGRIRISGPVTPEHRLVTYRVHVRKLIVRSSAIAIADGHMEVDGTPIYTADSLRVGLIPTHA